MALVELLAAFVADALEFGMELLHLECLEPFYLFLLLQ